ncbi:hypothetical protein I3I95_02220 [bacterium]|nr:hypothetical protein [bacterium]
MELTVADVNAWMADMTAGGYAPKSVGKPFRLLKQALKWGMAQVSFRGTYASSASPPSA